jgi:hypothetical protein
MYSDGVEFTAADLAAWLDSCDAAFGHGPGLLWRQALGDNTFLTELAMFIRSAALNAHIGLTELYAGLETSARDAR